MMEPISSSESGESSADEGVLQQDQGPERSSVATGDSASGSARKQTRDEPGKKRGSSTTATEAKSPASPPVAKKARKRRNLTQLNDNPDLDLHVDITTTSGQLAQNPHYTTEQAKSEAKREYNRRNAARSRVRNKHLMANLQERCALLSERVATVERENQLLRAQVAMFQEQRASTSSAGLTEQALQSSLVFPPSVPLAAQQQMSSPLLQQLLRSSDNMAQQQPLLAGRQPGAAGLLWNTALDPVNVPAQPLDTSQQQQRIDLLNLIARNNNSSVAGAAVPQHGGLLSALRQRQADDASGSDLQAYWRGSKPPPANDYPPSQFNS